MTRKEKAQAKFSAYHNAQGPHDEVYTDGWSKLNERVGAAAVINCHFHNGGTTCCQLSKRLPNESTIFAAEATAITLVLNYNRHMDPIQHDDTVYSDSMSCLQAIVGEDTENTLICQIMNLLWALSKQRYSWPLLLGGKPLWHWREWDSGPDSKVDPWPWASCQIRKIACCACAGNAGKVSPTTASYRSRHASRHVRDARAVMHAGIAY